MNVYLKLSLLVLVSVGSVSLQGMEAVLYEDSSQPCSQSYEYGASSARPSKSEVLGKHLLELEGLDGRIYGRKDIADKGLSVAVAKSRTGDILGFLVKVDVEDEWVPRESVQGIPQTATASDVQEFLDKGGMLWVDGDEDGYSIHADVAGDGGGLGLGWGLYHATRIIGYGAYGASVYLSGGWTLLDAELAYVAIETTAAGALYLGTIAPTI